MILNFAICAWLTQAQSANVQALALQSGNVQALAFGKRAECKVQSAECKVQSAKCKVSDNFLASLGNFHLIENKIDEKL